MTELREAELRSPEYSSAAGLLLSTPNTGHFLELAATLAEKHGHERPHGGYHAEVLINQVPPKEIYDPSRPTIGIVPWLSQSGSETMALAARHALYTDPNAQVPNVVFLPWLDPNNFVTRGLEQNRLSITHFSILRPDYYLAYYELPKGRRLSVDLLDISVASSDVLAYYESLGIPLFSGATSARGKSVGSDKSLVTLVGQQAHVRTPKSVVVNSGSPVTEIEQACDTVSGANGAVVKPLDGAQGENVRFLDEMDVEVAGGIVVTLAGEIGRVVVQERIASVPFVADGKRRDWNVRVMVRDGAYLGMYARTASWGTVVNVARGAIMQTCDDVFSAVWPEANDRQKVEADLIASAVRVGRTIGSGCFGLDFILTNNTERSSGAEPVLIEINDGYIGGMDDIAELHNGDVVAAYSPARTIMEQVMNSTDVNRAFMARPELQHVGEVFGDKLLQHMELITCNVQANIRPTNSNDFVVLKHVEVAIRGRYPITQRANFIYWNHLAYAYAAIGDFDKSRAIIQEIVTCWPQSGDTNTIVGLFNGLMANYNSRDES